MSAEDENLGDSPFSLLNAQGLPDAPPQNIQAKEIKIKKDVCLGRGERLEIRREKSGRGGKTVTTVQGFPTHLGPNKKTKK
jgi:translation initiation factor 1 (eIF-1/SUI1)